MGRATASPAQHNWMVRNGCQPLGTSERHGKGKAQALTGGDLSNQVVLLDWEWNEAWWVFTEHLLSVRHSAPTGGPVGSSTEPLPLGSLCLLEEGRQLTNM